MLGPPLFNIYVRGLPSVFHRCTFKATSFADDTNGMKTFSVQFQYNVVKNDIPKCLGEVAKWMNRYFLKINPDKTEILFLFPKELRDSVIVHGTFLEGQCIRFSSAVKNVGVWLDEQLSMNIHINKIVSHCYKLLKDIGRIRKMLTRGHTEMLVHPVISSRIDYCNSLF